MASGRTFDPWSEATPATYHAPTERQKEQKILFSKLGMVTREMANLRILVNQVQQDSTKHALNTAWYYLDAEKLILQQQMKTISKRIPA